jgi:hypothetical protein
VYGEENNILNWADRSQILGRNWDKSFSSLLFTVTSQMDFTPPPPHPPNKCGLKLVCNETLYMETSLNENVLHEFGFGAAKAGKKSEKSLGTGTSSPTNQPRKDPFHL